MEIGGFRVAAVTGFASSNFGCSVSFRVDRMIPGLVEHLTIGAVGLC